MIRTKMGYLIVVSFEGRHTFSFFSFQKRAQFNISFLVAFKRHGV